jgi:hypothetical protein
MPALLAWLLVVVVGAAAWVLLVADRRWLVIVCLGALALGAAGLQLGSISLRIVVSLAVGGLVVCSIIALSTREGHWRWSRGGPGALPQGRPFRMIAGAFMVVGMAGLSASGGPLIPGVRVEAQVAAALLAGLGALQMGLSEQSLRFGIGLLTVLVGFSLAYLLMEPSLALGLLLMGVQVSVALVVSYLVSVVGSGTEGEEAR